MKQISNPKKIIKRKNLFACPCPTSDGMPGLNSNPTGSSTVLKDLVEPNFF